MPSVTDVPSVCWTRRLDQMPEVLARPEPFPLSMTLRAKWSWWRRPKNDGPVIDMSRVGASFAPVHGVPLGGLGGGSVGRGWRGEFTRWHMRPGLYSYQPVWADQFSVCVRRAGQPPRAVVLSPVVPETEALRHWGWGMPGAGAVYHALYPRAWTVYNEPVAGVSLTCRQVSPIIPHNYRESSLPCGVFVWRVENRSSEAVEVGLLFTFQNGIGTPNDLAGGHSNRAFTWETPAGVISGVELRHIHRQPKPIVDKAAADEPQMYEDPLTFAIATLARPEVAVTYRTRFVTTESGLDVWGDFKEDARLINTDDERPAQPGMAIGAALAATVSVPAGETREIAFALAWDMPLARFGLGTAYYRRYTRFYGRGGDAAPALARDALLHYPEWETQIAAWQEPILHDAGLPDWYKAALFNELYYLVDGGTVWVDGLEGEPPPADDDLGHFAYLESHEYLLYNTYDVHFYASFALVMLWPKLELSIQRDFARAVFVEHPELVYLFGPGKYAVRKKHGAVPHDIGHPAEDPWRKVNAYDYQDAMRWKDLNSKFVLQVYRDYIATGDRGFAEETWEAVRAAIEYLRQFDRDADGVIDNEGFPDQTYDIWPVRGASAYSGGLWLAALNAAAALAEALGRPEAAAEYHALLARGREAYETKLWNGRYYKYDSSRRRQSDSIMADQLAGHWYARACGLPPLVPEAKARLTLETIFEFNVKRFADGDMGAVNGMRPNGRVDSTSVQAQEVWSGTTYALAAAMLQAGLRDEAFQTAHGVYRVVYEELGYWFQTPEAWNEDGDYRALAYMRPLAIWAMQWVLEEERRAKSPSQRIAEAAGRSAGK